MRVHALLLSASLAALCGCGGVSDGPKALVPVTGTILFENQPSPGIGVTFVPADGTSGVGASGASDADGKFTLLHNSTGEPGIEPGTYKVIFSRWRMPNGQPIPEGQSAADVSAVDTLPPHYTNPERTLYTETIPDSGKEGLEFKL